MRGKYKSYILTVVMLFFLTLSAESLFMGSDTIFQNASALTREFEENITVESEGFRVLDLSFSAGEELELIFYLEVEQGLPIDVWFVNYANYVRLVDGREFLFFIDGSQKNVTKATKIVTVTQHDAYALVFANYNDDTVDVYLNYDITVYPLSSETPPISGKVVDEQGDPIEGAIVQLKNNTGYIVATFTTLTTGDFEFRDIPFGTYNLIIFTDGYEENNEQSVNISPGTPTVDAGNIELNAISEPSDETPLSEEPYIMFPLGLVIGIIVVFLVFLVIGTSKKGISKKGNKTPSKPAKKTPSKKVKKRISKTAIATPSEKVTEKKTEETQPDTEKKAPTQFCGSCGSPVDTKFCPNCGEEAGKA
jgi:hypothetical protein